MSKIKYNKEDAAHLFEINPAIDHLLVTEDGHFFLPKNSGFCKTHCDRNNLKFEKILKSTSETSNVEFKKYSKEELESKGFEELKSICLNLDLRLKPKSKASAIEEIIKIYSIEEDLDLEDGQEADVSKIIENSENDNSINTEE